MPEALICPFCRTKLVAENQLPVAGRGSPAKEEQKPGLWRVMFFNLLCPGMGAWKLGHRLRGVIVFCLITASIGIYTNEILPQIQRKVDVALRTGKTSGLSTLEADISNNPWLDVAFYLYVLSFIDAYFLVANSAKKPEPGDAA
ncbi:MAG: hypothetical protein PHD82_03760 [Candidatus Riflebacteria bacterium]|nr:hypothetical protein [Candidatus Riflebacteria bacterium]